MNDISDKGTVSLLLVVLLKYGIAPLVCLYFAWANYQKDERNERQTEKFAILVEAGTAATVKNTEVLSQLGRIVEKNTQKLEEIERRK